MAKSVYYVLRFMPGKSVGDRSGPFYSRAMAETAATACLQAGAGAATISKEVIDDDRDEK